MNDNGMLIARIKDAIAECEIHIKRISEALSKLKKYLPLTEDIYNNFTNDNIQALDQFIYRYTKLQDKIGSSILKNLVYLLEYSDNTRTFIDMLNILEKHNIIASANKWKDFRDLRNRLTHEYINNIDLQVKLLNDVYDAYLYMQKEFLSIKEYCEKVI